MVVFGSGRVSDCIDGGEVRVRVCQGILAKQIAAQSAYIRCGYSLVSAKRLLDGKVPLIGPGKLQTGFSHKQAGNRQAQAEWRGGGFRRRQRQGSEKGGCGRLERPIGGYRSERPRA